MCSPNSVFISSGGCRRRPFKLLPLAMRAAPWPCPAIAHAARAAARMNATDVLRRLPAWRMMAHDRAAVSGGVLRRARLRPTAGSNAERRRGAGSRAVVSAVAAGGPEGDESRHSGRVQAWPRTSLPGSPRVGIGGYSVAGAAGLRARCRRRTGVARSRPNRHDASPTRAAALPTRCVPPSSCRRIFGAPARACAARAMHAVKVACAGLSWTVDAEFGSRKSAAVRFNSACSPSH